MTVLVFGAQTAAGQVLSEVAGITAVNDRMANPARPADCCDLIGDLRPTAVINLAMIIPDRMAEDDPARCHTILGATPGAMAGTCATLDIPFVHVNPNTVFDGRSPMAYIPGDLTNPDTALGNASLAGEIAIHSMTARNVILRTSWVFDHNIYDQLALFGVDQREGAFTIHTDVSAAPTSAASVAQAALTIAGALVTQPQKAGVYHFAGDGFVALSEFVRQVLRLDRDFNTTVDVQSNGTKPSHRLDCRTTKAVFGLDRPNWRNDLTGILQSHHIKTNVAM
ncbi:MAG: sugar nucleotide-binding protein [Planktomarina sp.]